MALNLSLLVSVKEPVDQPTSGYAEEVSPPLPWLAAGWPELPVSQQQSFAEAQSGYQLLRQLIGGTVDAATPSVAALTAAMDGLAAAPLRWRADPVSLIPDRDQLVVIPGKLTNLSMAEAETLVALLNSHFHEDFQLEIGAPHRWYLTPTEPLVITASPLDAVSGGSAGLYQAAGPTAMRLQQWLNEIQMALYGVPSNQQREANDQFLLNSLWVWGNNQSESPPGDRVSPAQIIAPDLVIADSGWAAALAEHHQVPLLPLPKPGEWLDQLPPTGNVVIDLARVDGDRLPDYAEVQACCEQLQPIIGKQVSAVDIYALARDQWQRRCLRGSDFGFLGRLRARIKMRLSQSLVSRQP